MVDLAWFVPLRSAIANKASRIEPIEGIHRVRCATVQQDVRSRAARCSQHDCAARYITHTKMVAMLAIYCHSLSMASTPIKSTQICACSFLLSKIPGCQIPRGIPRGMPNSLREFGTGMPNPLGYHTVR